MTTIDTFDCYATLLTDVVTDVHRPLFIPAMQVGSRIWVLWGIVNLVPEICSLGSVPVGRAGGVDFAFNYTTLLYAWAITEVIRYFFYAIKV